MAYQMKTPVSLAGTYAGLAREVKLMQFFRFTSPSAVCLPFASPKPIRLYPTPLHVGRPLSRTV